MTTNGMSLHHSLYALRQAADDIWDKSCPDDFTPRQYAILDAIDRGAGEGTLSQTDLVAATSIDRSTLSDVIRRLQGRGFVHRRRTKEDARAYNVKLTATGAARLKRARPVAATVEKKLTAGLDSGQISTLTAILGAMVTRYEKDSAHH